MNKLILRDNGRRNRAKATLFALFLVLTIAVAMVALPIVFPIANAHTPPMTLPTFAYLAVAPNPVGVGQTIFLVIWVSPNPPTALGNAGDRWRDFKIEITKPNGDTQTLGPYYSDPTGSTFTLFTPDQVGTYKFVFKYPGQVMSLTGPNGLTADLAGLVSRGTDVYINDTFLPSSDTKFLTVQQQPIERIADYPMPASYWTRPIEGQNSLWWTVASNWLGGAQLGTLNLWQIVA